MLYFFAAGRRHREVPTERLGYGADRFQAVQKHKWFDGFSWEGLQNRSLTPPIVPQVSVPAHTIFSTTIIIYNYNNYN